MYKCNSCNEVFKEPKINKYKERHEVWGADVIQNCEELLCPCCLNEDFDEISVKDYIKHLINEDGLSPENARIEACAVFGLKDDFDEWDE